MNEQEAILWLKAIEDKYIHGGDEGFDEKRKMAICMGIKALETVQKIPEVIAQLENYKCEDATSGYQMAMKNVHYNDAIVLLKDLLKCREITKGLS